MLAVQNFPRNTLHTLQFVPPEPQASTSESPGAHAPPLNGSQQPLAQVAGPHGPLDPPPPPPPPPVPLPPPPPVPAAQTPLWQVIVPVQAEQAPPLRPHSALVGGVMQVLPSQQPVGQMVALHGVAQAPFEHGWPLAQATQAAPPLPQKASAFPA